MVKTERKKNAKVMSSLDNIEFLNLLKTQSLQEIAQHFNISLRGAQYKRRKFGAYTDEDIEDAIMKIENDVRRLKIKVPVRNYDKEEVCLHTQSKIFLKCPNCTLVVGENNLNEIISILTAIRDAQGGNKPLFQGTI